MELLHGVYNVTASPGPGQVQGMYTFLLQPKKGGREQQPLSTEQDDEA